jgi:hypothetical protein
VLYGYDPVVATAPLLPPTDNKSAQELLADTNLHMSLIKQHLGCCTKQNQATGRQNRIDREFVVGEQVLLHLQSYAQSSVVNRSYPKIPYKFFGPYQVLEKIDKAAYRMELPDNSLIHPVFHVSQLKSFTPDYTG